MAKPYKRAFTLIIVTRKPPTSVSNETSLRQVFFACNFPVFGNAFVRGMGTNTWGSDLRGTLPSPTKYAMCCSQSRWRKRTERLYWSWWNSLRIIHVQIAELPVRAWNLVFHHGLHIGALWFEFSIDFVRDFLCCRSWMGLGVEGDFHLYHMQWNPQEFRSTSVCSQVSQAWYVDRWKTEGKMVNRRLSEC